MYTGVTMPKKYKKKKKQFHCDDNTVAHTHVRRGGNYRDLCARLAFKKSFAQCVCAYIPLTYFAKIFAYEISKKELRRLVATAMVANGTFG